MNPLERAARIEEIRSLIRGLKADATPEQITALFIEDLHLNMDIRREQMTANKEN